MVVEAVAVESAGLAAVFLVNKVIVFSDGQEQKQDTEHESLFILIAAAPGYQLPLRRRSANGDPRWRSRHVFDHFQSTSSDKFGAQVRIVLIVLLCPAAFKPN